MKTTTSAAGLLIAASVFSSIASASVTIDWVTVGNPGNAADTTGYGAVNYEYKIGKYEVTNAQYGEFLNAKGQSNSNGIYNSSMSSYGITQSGSTGSYTYSVTSALANRPVVYVSWFEAARFANWLTNGQGNGDTETGAYTLNGASSGIITANAGAQVYIPTKNEWYKAAYYNGTTGTYSLFPNGKDMITTAEANYFRSINHSTDVGNYSVANSYGTYDQAGNVSEWSSGGSMNPGSENTWGGNWTTDSTAIVKSYSPGFMTSNHSSEVVGFRLASVPEPSAVALMMLSSVMMLIHRKR
jgi:sulfatase modifying factor 1